MDRKSERLVRKIEKAGIRKSIKEGHVLNEAELRRIRIQVIPNPVRIMFIILGVVCAAASYWYFSNDSNESGAVFAVGSVFMILFGAFGFRRTLWKILDSIHVIDAAEITAHAIKGIASAVESLFDGV